MQARCVARKNVLEDANRRLIEMAQAGQIAGSKTLAEYLLAAKNVPPVEREVTAEH
jgi:hypothetical protein